MCIRDRIFCLAATGFIAGTALCLPIGVRKVSGDEKAELQLERGALGSQPTEEKLEVSVGNQKPERITLSVPARAYSAEAVSYTHLDVYKRQVRLCEITDCELKQISGNNKDYIYKGNYHTQ